VGPTRCARLAGIRSAGREGLRVEGRIERSVEGDRLRIGLAKRKFPPDGKVVVDLGILDARVARRHVEVGRGGSAPTADVVANAGVFEIAARKGGIEHSHFSPGCRILVQRVDQHRGQAYAEYRPADEPACTIRWKALIVRRKRATEIRTTRRHSVRIVKELLGFVPCWRAPFQRGEGSLRLEEELRRQEVDGPVAHHIPARARHSRRTTEVRGSLSHRGLGQQDHETKSEQRNPQPEQGQREERRLLADMPHCLLQAAHTHGRTPQHAVKEVLRSVGGKRG
jgi:hypothetical protein